MKSNISNLHLELLDKERLEVLYKLVPFMANFILGGGTALLLQLAHRKSFDFDFFSSSQISKNLLEKITKSLPVENIVVDTRDELTFFTSNALKITFLYYPFNILFEDTGEEGTFRLFPIKEIAIQKAYTIGRRGEYRDYFDLYTILKNGYVNLKEVIAQAKRAYNGAFDEKLLLEQLVYYGDIRSFDITPVSKSQVLPTPDEVKQYFETLVQVYIK